MGNDKEKVLFFCNTNYQIIMAINIALSVKKNSECYLIISDSSNNSFIYYNNAKKCKIFKRIFYIEHKKIIKELNRYKKYILLFYYQLSKNNPIFYEIKNEYFDEVIAYNLSLSLGLLISQLIKKNNKIKCSRMEEGLISYNYIDNNTLSNVSVLNRILNFFHFNEFIKRQNILYCLYPDSYNGRLQSQQIPMLNYNNYELVNNLNIIFGINNRKLIYDKKYIFFSSILDFDGGESIGELKLAKEIANLVGYDNLLVKTHPRDNPERFIKEGLNVDTNSTIPWEIIQLNYNFSNHVFISVCSSSVISINLIITNPSKTYYIYPFSNYHKNQLAIKTWNNLLKLLNDSRFKDKFDKFISIPNKLEDIVQN